VIEVAGIGGAALLHQPSDTARLLQNRHDRLVAGRRQRSFREVDRLVDVVALEGGVGECERQYRLRLGM
jgi:hypothetical protein